MNRHDGLSGFTLHKIFEYMYGIIVVVMLRQLGYFTFLFVFITPAFSATVSPGDILKKRCTECHNIDLVNRTPKSQAQWERTVDRMISYGATLDKEEREIIIKYLAGK
ncbi:MAG: hypothetical protein ABIB41_12200 [Nitrospirota bacterium]